MKRIRHYSRNQVAKSNKEKSTFDLAKWAALFLSILGIQAWIAGAAYEGGYWGAAGLDGPLVTRSMQHTALMGFIGAFRVWTGAAVSIAVVGVFIIMLAISFRGKTERKERNRTRFEDWIVATFTFDKSIGRFGLVVAFFGPILFAGLLIPLALWSVAAHREGRDLLVKQACDMRDGKGKNASIRLQNGSIVEGRLIDRAEKTVAFLIPDLIQVFVVGDRSELLYMIKLDRLHCS